jgi:hypothetical protein
MWIEVHIQAMSKTIIQILASWSLDISLLKMAIMEKGRTVFGQVRKKIKNKKK